MHKERDAARDALPHRKARAAERDALPRRKAAVKARLALPKAKAMLKERDAARDALPQRKARETAVRPWWRPCLPMLTEEGLLLVPDEGPEPCRRQIHSIWDGLQAGTCSTEVPQADRDLISVQVLEWLRCMAKPPAM